MEKHYVLKFNDSEKDYKMVFSKDCQVDLADDLYIVKGNTNWGEPPIGICNLGRDEEGLYLENTKIYKSDDFTILEKLKDKVDFSISGWILKKEGEVVTQFSVDNIIVRGKMDEDKINKNTELSKPG